MDEDDVVVGAVVEGEESIAINPRKVQNEIQVQEKAGDRENQSVIWGKQEHTEGAPRTVPTVVELGILVSISWVCPRGLPDIRDRQRAFCPMVGGKMSYMSVRVNKGMG